MFISRTNLCVLENEEATHCYRSSAEVKYKSVVNTSCEIKWLAYIMQDLQVEVPLPISLHSDNAAAVAIDKNPILHDKIKHVELDIHFVRDMIASKFLTPIHIASILQVADLPSHRVTNPWHHFFNGCYSNH